MEWKVSNYLNLNICITEKEISDGYVYEEHLLRYTVIVPKYTLHLYRF